MPTLDPRQEWRTPQDFWRVLNAEFQFELDAAASAENALCPMYLEYVDEMCNALTVWWVDRSLHVYCNPGFSDMLPWVKKAYEQSQRHPSAIVVVMALVAPSTEWWNTYALKADEIRLLAPRIQFEPAPGVKKSSNARENCLIIFRGTPIYNYSDEHPRIWTWNWKADNRGENLEIENA